MISPEGQILLDLARLAYFANVKRKLSQEESLEWVSLRFKMSTPEVHKLLHQMFFDVGVYGGK